MIWNQSFWAKCRESRKGFRNPPISAWCPKPDNDLLLDRGDRTVGNKGTADRYEIPLPFWGGHLSRSSHPASADQRAESCLGAGMRTQVKTDQRRIPPGTCSRAHRDLTLGLPRA